MGIFLALSVEGALSVFMGTLTPDLVLIVLLLFSSVRGGSASIFLAFIAGMMLDLRWEPVVGLSSVYLCLAVHLMNLFHGSSRRRSRVLRYGMAFLFLFLFYIFKFVFYTLLSVEYDLSYPVLLGRIVMDLLLFGIGTVVLGRRKNAVV